MSKHVEEGGNFIRTTINDSCKTNQKMNCDGTNKKPTQLNQSNPLCKKIELHSANKVVTAMTYKPARRK